MPAGRIGGITVGTCAKGNGMSYNTPPQIAAVAIDSGVTKAGLPAGRALVAGFLAGAYIAFASLLAIIVSAGLKPEQWGGLITLVTGLAFSLGLILVLVAGSELVTGNMALIPIAVFAGKVKVSRMLHNWFFVTIGNLAGSLFVAYFLADKTGVLAKTGSVTATEGYARLGALAMGKAVTENHLEQLLRAVGCNWLVCLAVWMALAADDIGGKVLAIFFPITAFVALGFDHVVANMFFLPAAVFANVPGIGWSDVLHNLALAFVGNFVGATVFVAGAYWWLYGRDEEETATHARGTSGNGVVGAERARSATGG